MSNLPNSPHERVHGLLISDKAALRLHRELTVALANGDAETASDCASALAKRMQKFSAAQEQPEHESSQTTEVSDAPPAPTASTMELLIEKAAAPQLSGSTTGTSDGSESAAASEINAVTILSTDFESENEDDLLDIKILDEYLKKENEAWKEQKRAVANRILVVAKELGITPEVVHGSETEQMKDETFRPLRHVNLVIRAEMSRLDPEVEASVRTAAEAIKLRLEEKQQLVSQSGEQGSEEQIVQEHQFVGQVAFLELVAAKSHMKYSLGLHKDLEAALGQELAQKFVSCAVSNLNSSEKSDDVAIIRRVVLPYTAMIKLCLWYRADMRPETTF